MSAMTAGSAAEVQRASDEVTVVFRSVRKGSGAQRSQREDAPNAAASDLRRAARADAKWWLIEGFTAFTACCMKHDRILWREDLTQHREEDARSDRRREDSPASRLEVIL